jgi:hypothetical protein
MRVLAIITICIAYLIVHAVMSLGQEVDRRKSIAAVEDVDGRTGDDIKSRRRADRLRAMQKIAEGLTVETIDTEGKTKVGLVEGARFRFSTPEIGVFDGTAWLWGTGRPLALLTISAEQFEKDGPCRYSYELTSLAPLELSVTSQEGWEWKPEKAGLDFQPLPDAPAPAESHARRQRQIKDLSRRFDAYSLHGPDRKSRLELRILPTPIYSYADKQAGVRDGAMFFLAGGTNPEALLAIERSGEGPAEPVWKFALNRVSAGELHARFDGKEIWSCEQQRENTIRDPYYILMRPMPPELGNE